MLSALGLVFPDSFFLCSSLSLGSSPGSFCLLSWLFPWLALGQSLAREGGGVSGVLVRAAVGALLPLGGASPPHPAVRRLRPVLAHPAPPAPLLPVNSGCSGPRLVSRYLKLLSLSLALFPRLWSCFFRSFCTSLLSRHLSSFLGLLRWSPCPFFPFSQPLFPGCSLLS